MRNIPTAALAKLAQDQGTEPVCIIEVDWVGAGLGSSVGRYADKEIPAMQAKGSILEISGLDDVIKVDGSGLSRQVSVTLSDEDGDLKSIIDSNDVHGMRAWVYQWYTGLDPSDKFLLFDGVINTPLEWNEGDRTLKFDILSKLEDVEVGFSLEEGQFPDIQDDLVGKALPLVFGTCDNVPCVRLSDIISGVLLDGTGIRDPHLLTKISAARGEKCPNEYVKKTITVPGRFVPGQTVYGAYTTGVQSLLWQPEFSVEVMEDTGKPSEQCLREHCVYLKTLEIKYQEQGLYLTTPVRVQNGERFLQQIMIYVRMGDALFKGYFSGEDGMGTGNLFNIIERYHPGTAGSQITDTRERLICGSEHPPEQGTGTLSHLGPKEKAARALPELGFHWVPAGTKVSYAGPAYSTPGQTVEQSHYPWRTNETGILVRWTQGSMPYSQTLPGATPVTDFGEAVFICNILPSLVHHVSIKSTVQGREMLLTVPIHLYQVREVDYNGYICTEIVFKGIGFKGVNWEDAEIYATLTSDEGPNPVDVMRWFIETYSQYTLASSFEDLRDYLDTYPMHFALLERRQLFDVLQNLAHQARCAIWHNDNEFHLRYLSEQPDHDDEIGEEDVIPGSLQLYHSSTDDLATKYTVEWIDDYIREKPIKAVYRHNVGRYGSRDHNDDYFSYTIWELVDKTATFWLIRTSNIWRRVKLSTYLNKLNLETFDSVLLDLPQVSDEPVVCIIESAVYNSDSKTIEFDLWTPIRSGERRAYDFAYPAQIEASVLFPSIEDQQSGRAGGGSEPNFSTIVTGNHPLSADKPDLPDQAPAAQGGGLLQATTTCWEAGSIKTFKMSGLVDCEEEREKRRARKDEGDKKPSDKDDVKPEKKVKGGTEGTTGEDQKNTTPDNPQQQAEKQELKQQIQEGKDRANDAMTKANGGGGGGGGGGGDGSDSGGNGGPGPGGPDTGPGSFNDPELDVPPCDDTPGQCLATVVVTMGYFTTIRKWGIGCPGGMSGPSGTWGTGHVGIPTNVHHTSTICVQFNSHEAADRFNKSMVDAIEDLKTNCGAVAGASMPVHSIYLGSSLGTDLREFLTNEDGTVQVDFEGNPKPNPNYMNSCPEPPPEEQGMTNRTEEEIPGSTPAPELLPDAELPDTFEPGGDYSHLFA